MRSESVHLSTGTSFAFERVATANNPCRIPSRLPDIPIVAVPKLPRLEAVGPSALRPRRIFHRASDNIHLSTRIQVLELRRRLQRGLGLEVPPESRSERKSLGYLATRLRTLPSE